MDIRVLQGMKVAALVADGVEQVELTEPKKALEEFGAQVLIVSPEQREVQAMHHMDKADKFKVDIPLDQANPNDFDALLLPGGVANPDKLRTIDNVKSFVRTMNNEGKPIAFICHAAWTLISAGLVKGRTLTSYPSLQDDVKNAGGNWVDQEVVEDGNWVSSRSPRDFPAFNKAMVRLFANYCQMKKAA